MKIGAATAECRGGLPAELPPLLLLLTLLLRGLKCLKVLLNPSSLPVLEPRPPIVLAYCLSVYYVAGLREDFVLANYGACCKIEALIIVPDGEKVLSL